MSARIEPSALQMSNRGAPRIAFLMLLRRDQRDPNMQAHGVSHGDVRDGF